IYSHENIPSSSNENVKDSEEKGEVDASASKEDLQTLVKKLEEMTQGNYVSHIKEIVFGKSSQLWESLEDVEEIHSDKENDKDIHYSKWPTSQHQKRKRHILPDDFKYHRQYYLPARSWETNNKGKDDDSSFEQYDEFSNYHEQKDDNINYDSLEPNNLIEYDSHRGKASLLSYITKDIIKKKLVNHPYADLNTILNQDEEPSLTIPLNGFDDINWDGHLNDIIDDSQTSFETPHFYQEQAL
ncbi:unnamed protein product, partial [Meganyctiphanes norvegica]